MTGIFAVFRRCAQTTQNGDAVLAGQHDIQQNQLRLAFFQSSGQRRTVLEAISLKTGVAQRVHHQFADTRIIFHTDISYCYTPISVSAPPLPRRALRFYASR